MRVKSVLVRRGRTGAFALAMLAGLVGSQAAVASVTTPQEAISFKKVRYIPDAGDEDYVKPKKVRKKRLSSHRRYKLRKLSRRKISRKHSTRQLKKPGVNKRYGKVSPVQKKRALRKLAGKSHGRKSLRSKARRARLLRKSTRRKSASLRTIGRRPVGRGRRALMATLRSVKPRGLPLSLAAAVVTVESGWRVNARGSSGERGLMQLMPATARRMGVRGNLFNPHVNMRAGTRYLHWCYRRARGNVAATIGCYNRGPGLMWSWSRNSITRRYVGKVRRYMRRS